MILLRSSLIAFMLLLAQRPSARPAGVRLLIGLALMAALFTQPLQTAERLAGAPAWSQGLPDLPVVGQADPAQDLDSLAHAVPATHNGLAPAAPWLGESAEKDLLAHDPGQPSLTARPLPPEIGLAQVCTDAFLAPPLRPPRV